MVAKSYGDVVKCIDANIPGFRQDLLEYYGADGGIAILSGSQLMEDPEELFYPVDVNTLVITPIPEGSKSGGAKILLGALLIASLFIPGSGGLLIAGLHATGLGLGAATAAASVLSLSIASIGINLALTGLQQLLAPDPSVDTNDQEYLFDGPQVTVASGNPVPVLCGEMIIGGILMSSAVVPGLPVSAGHVGGYTPGVGGTITLPGGGWGAFGGNLGGDIVDPTGGTIGSGFDIIADSGLTEPTDNLILYSESTFTKPWVARVPTMGISYIVPTVPHEIPEEYLAEHNKAIMKALYKKEVLWDDVDDVLIGTLPATGNLFKILDNATVVSAGEFSGTETTASLSVTLDNATVFSQTDAAIVGVTAVTLTDATVSSAASFAGVSETVGDLAVTLDSATVVSAASAEFIAEVAFTTGDATISSVGTSEFIATSEPTTDDATLEATGTYTAGSAYETESEALFARFTSDPGSTRKGHINTAIASLKSAGVWSKLDSLFVFAAHDRQGAYEDWKASRTAVDVGTGPNFTTDNYISNQGSSSNYLNTTLNSTTLSRDSASHFGVATKSSGGYRRIIEENGGFLASYITTPDGTFTRTRHKFASFVEHGGSTSSAISYVSAVDDGTNIVPYRDGSAGTTQTRSGGGWFGTWRMLADSDTANNMKIYAFHFGGSLTATEIGDLNTALATYFTAIGAS